MTPNSTRLWHAILPAHASLKLSTNRLIRIVLIVVLLVSAKPAAADWWETNYAHTENPGANTYFKANFNYSTGKVHIESFVYNGEYLKHLCCQAVAMWVQWATLSISNDGITYTDFYNFGYDHENIQYADDINGFVVTSRSSSSSAHGDRLIAFDLNITNAFKNAKFIRLKAGLAGDGDNGTRTIEDSKTLSITQMTTIGTPAYNFVPIEAGGIFSPKATISYSKVSNNEVDAASQMFLFDASTNPDTRLQPDVNVGTTGSYNVATANAPKDYYFKQFAYSERIYNNSATITVPAFTFPKTALATYDPVAQQAKVTWTIDPVTSAEVVTDKFKIQIADNANFTDAREAYVDYDAAKASFTYPVSNNLAPQMFFRVSRQHSGFNWQISKQASVSVIFNSIPANSTVTLKNNKIANITWDPLSSAWIPGSSFLITRYNTTNNTQGEIRLAKEDFDKGVYNDAQISVCNNYTYALQVVPPANSSFVAFAKVPVQGEVLPTELGSISNLEVSKGYYPDKTEIRWSTSGAFDYFIIKRAAYGSTNFVQVATVTKSGSNDYQAFDAQGTPGVYYSYQVSGVVKCNNNDVFSNETLTGVGFRSPTGNIYGRITYENGQAVENVAVRVQSSDAVQLGRSVYLNGTIDSYLKLNNTSAAFSDEAFTVEAWIRPDATNPTDQVIFCRNNQYQLGFNSAGQLFFSYQGQMVTGAYTNPFREFIHVAGVHTKDSLLVMLNGDVVGRIGATFAASTPDNIVYIGRGVTDKFFKGYIDEMRVFNAALPTATIAANKSRLLTGNETDLIAYWRFDETISDEFYDLSHNGEAYNRNDGIMNPSAVVRSATVPTADQLALKAFTDVGGNYLITGIPYVGNGTAYTIVPLNGTHQFDPVSVNRFLSPNSQQFAVDFKDKSAFPVSGYVYYQNTTVPVPGVQFKIDGQYAQKGSGEIIETTEDGFFEISVPVGIHEVKGVKANHVFENDGKFIDLNKKNFNYQNSINGLTLADSTTIRFIGRVAGGAIQSELPLGHSVSVNNLGKDLTLTLLLTTGNKYELNKASEATEVTVKHLLPSNIKDPARTSKTQVTYYKNRIIIKPDPLTGEFAADLIPVKFLANSVEVTGWNDILDGKPVLLDFIDKFALQTSRRDYVDSVLNTQNAYVKTNYSDSVKYNTSYKFIKRVEPSVAVVQTDDNGQEVRFFGNINYESVSALGKKENIVVVDTNKAGQSMYNFGNPVFIKNQLVKFKVSAFEQYPFYEEGAGGVAIIKQQGGKDVVDKVPTSDGFVSVLNTIRNGSSAPDTFSLDNTGKADYEFYVGDPSLATQGIKNLSTNIRFGEATNVNWLWYGDAQLRAYVMGGKLTGTDFVTAGPDKVITVLRDPPGATSSSYIEKGSTITHTTTYSGSIDSQGDEEFTQQLGGEIVTFVGLGGGTINAVTATTGSTIGIHHEEHLNYGYTHEESSTFTTKFQTSNDPLFVGPVADVFIGYSTNITYGQSNNITIVRRQDVAASDILLFSPSPNSTYVVVQRGGISIGQSFGTLFALPQQHIEKILIPNLLNIRNLSLLPPTTSSTDAQAQANVSGRPIYVSKFAVGTPNFGKSNNDTAAFGLSAKTDPFGNGKSYRIFFPENTAYRTDTIMMLNQYVSNWEKRMADNEKAKLESTLQQNYSFHAATPIEYSEQTTIKDNVEASFNFVLSGSVVASNDTKINGMGFEFKLNEKRGVSQTLGGGSSSEASTTLGFSLGSNGTDDNFTMDLRRAADSSLVFHTKGGASGCPYVGATISKYYQPGTVIDEPTQRIEVPVIIVDKPVANNVPSSRKAVYYLTLRNESEAKLPATFVLGYTDNDSIKGATLAVDGTPIGGAGRAIFIQFGESITKVLTLTKGPDAMDYNNIQLLWRSNCQYDPTGYRENIADTVLLSAHFIPSCSDISIKSPKDKWVLNSESPKNVLGKRYLPITIDNFDVNNSLFDHIELQYKPTASSTWINAISFYADPDKLNAAQGEKELITNAGAIQYNFVLDDASFNDQSYDIQAVAFCKVGEGNYVSTESNLVTGIKDTYTPRLFGSPQPANGVLTVNDDVRLNFNETIAAGLLTNSDFQVTGIRNGAVTNHSVSVRLDGVSNYLATEFEKSFTGKNITAEAWVLPDGSANQTIFSHGSTAESLELSLTADNKMQVTVGSTVIKSTLSYMYKPGQWAHVAMVYNDASKTVSAYYDFTEMIHAAPVSGYTGTGHIEYGRSISKGKSYFSGKLHDARIWSDTLTSIQLQINSLTVLAGSENGLMAYYPMNEGKGTTAFDKAHGSNAMLNGYWSTPAGKAVKLNGNGYVNVNTSFAAISSMADYTLQMWFKGDASQSNSTLASNGKGDGTDVSGSLNLFNLGFEGGLLTFTNNAFKVQAIGNFLDNKWHQVSIAVNRNAGSAQLFIDGELNLFFDAKSLGGIASSSITLGALTYYTTGENVASYDRFFSGNVDEFRLWNTYLNQTLVATNSNTKLQGNEIGLLAYYPFETYIMSQGYNSLYYSLKDAKIQEVPTVVVPDAMAKNALESDETAPMKDPGPISNLKFDFVVNNDALIINLQESRQAIDKTVVTFKAKNVRDLNGNKIMSPITWTAYIDQNQLKWSDKELTLVKEVGRDFTFQSYLENSGGTSQRFTIYNLPSWLKVSLPNGTVDPLSSLKVNFTVNAGLNIGSYEEIIYMRNDNNEIEALKVMLQVKGRKPDWNPIASDYLYDMVVYGKLRLNNLFSTNKEDLLGAFINGKCVGVANNTFNASNNLWYTFLRVYNNDLKSTDIEFRIWQASTGKTFRAIPSKTILFANDGINGTASVPIIFDASSLYYQDITINKNWNWVSFNLAIPFNTPLDTVLVNGRWTEDDIVKNDAPGKGDEKGFASYSNNGEWKGSLKTLGNLSLYKVKAATAQSLTLKGTAVDVANTVIPLKGAQWNYISYLPQLNATLKEALAGYTAADGDVIKSQTGFSMYSEQNGWIGSLTYLEPGKGYMLYRKPAADASFKYPLINGSLGGRQNQEALSENETPVPGNYSNADNMTVAAVLSSKFEFKTGDLVLAYVNGNLQGKAKALYNPVIKGNTYFFTIAGDAEQLVVFVVERAGQVIAQSSTGLTYKSNSYFGSLAEPLFLDFINSKGSISTYPNPFTNLLNININMRNLPGVEHKVQLSVVDVLGRVVMQMPVRTVTGTAYRASWNGRNNAGAICNKGTYFMKVVIDGLVQIQTVVKQ